MLKKYTLEPLRELRHDRVAELSRAVGVAQAAHLAAREAAFAARQLREAEQARALAVRQAERQRLEAGEVLVADLQQGERYWVGASERALGLLKNEVGAEQKAATAADGEHRARGELAQARADAEALDRHHARFAAEQRRSADLAEEEAQLDRWTADNYGKHRA